MRYLLIGMGSVSVFLGVLGIFLPLLPTTPFLLLACALYAKSSERFHAWLLNQKVLGKYIRDYTERRGLPITSKVITLLFLWVTIVLSIVLATDNLIMRILLLILAMAVSLHILSLKTLKG
jgi:uncharacterized membrane protein YbaN (DUF454 family)